MIARVRNAFGVHVLRAALEHAALRRVVGAFLLYNVGIYASWVGLLLYAYESTGAASVGVVALATLLPAAVAAPFTASLADRYPRQRVLVAGYAVQAAAYAAVTAAMLLGVPAVLVYVLSAVYNATLTTTAPAQGALLPQLSRTPEELTAANSVAGTAQGLGVLLGPVAASPILAVATPSAVWAAATVAGIVAALLVVRLRVPAVGTAAAEPPPGASPASGDPAEPPPSRGSEAPPAPAARGESGLEMLLGGVRALAASRDTALVVGLLGIRMLVSGAMDILFVVLALEVFGTGNAGAGVLNAALGLGTVLGGVVSLSLIGRRRMAPAIALSTLAWGVPIALTGSVAPAALAPVLVAVGGIGYSSLEVAGRTLLQRVTEDHQLARILGVLNGAEFIFLALGSVAAPLLVASIGAEGALLVAALVLPGSVVLGWLPLRGLDRRGQVPVREQALLAQNAIFAPLPAPQAEAVARRTRWLTLRAGDVLLREGDAGDRFYVLESGVLDVTIRGEHVRTVDAPGEGVGEIALLRGVPRTATVTAAAACVLLALDRVDFLTAVTGHPPAAEAGEAVAASRRMAADGAAEAPAP